MTESDAEEIRREPLLSYRAMFDAELDQAAAELERPALALFASGVIAGASVGVSVFLLALIVSAHGAVPQEPLWRLLFGSAYAAGFVVAILGRTDLFTEYTTIAIFPVLTGDGRLSQLARLWGLVFAGNMAGGAAIGLLIVVLAPALEVADARAFGLLGAHLAEREWWVIALSAVLAGWLMGMLSWLIAGGRDTTSQILFIWLIGTTIGALGLHHSVTGGVELFTAALADPGMNWATALAVLAVMTAGNAVGGVIFALLVEQGVRMDPATPSGRPDREDGRKAHRRSG